jgi:uncharacterized protein
LTVAAAFLDTFYIFAVIDSRDDWHTIALRWEQVLASQRRPLVTTEYVLVGVADGLAKLPRRGLVDAVLARLEQSPDVEIVPGSTELFAAGMSLFRRRADKEWSLTDCISFVVMRQRGLTEGLTADHHFEQAGFRALLLHPAG